MADPSAKEFIPGGLGGADAANAPTFQPGAAAFVPGGDGGFGVSPPLGAPEFIPGGTFGDVGGADTQQGLSVGSTEFVPGGGGGGGIHMSGAASGVSGMTFVPGVGMVSDAASGSGGMMAGAGEFVPGLSSGLDMTANEFVPGESMVGGPNEGGFEGDGGYVDDPEGMMGMGMEMGMQMGMGMGMGMGQMSVDIMGDGAGVGGDMMGYGRALTPQLCNAWRAS